LPGSSTTTEIRAQPAAAPALFRPPLLDLPEPPSIPLHREAYARRPAPDPLFRSYNRPQRSPVVEGYLRDFRIQSEQMMRDVGRAIANLERDGPSCSSSI